MRLACHFQGVWQLGACGTVRYPSDAAVFSHLICCICYVLASSRAGGIDLEDRKGVLESQKEGADNFMSFWIQGNLVT